MKSEENKLLKEANLTNQIKVAVVSSYGTINGCDINADLINLSTVTMNRIGFATKISLLVNITLFLIKIAVFIETNSFAVIAALTDSFCDLVSQMILFYTQRAVRKQKANFPAGRTRLEPVGILIMSILMIILSCFVIFASIFTLYRMYVIHLPFEVGYSLWSVLLLVVSIVLKFCLWCYCKQFISSPSAMALAEDHRNDVLSNSTAVIAVCVASQYHKFVFVDPTGGLLISLYIIYSWYNIGIEESNKLIGVRADESNLNVLHQFLKTTYEKQIKEYSLNGYFIGRNMLIELRFLHRNCNTCNQYKQLCDLSLNIQHKIESFQFVERAFVNFDYIQRKSIHKVPVLN